MLQTAQREKLQLLRRFQQERLPDAANTTAVGTPHSLREHPKCSLPKGLARLCAATKGGTQLAEC